MYNKNLFITKLFFFQDNIKTKNTIITRYKKIQKKKSKKKNKKTKHLNFF